MAKIKKIALTKLLKLQLPQFFIQITDIVARHNPEELKLNDTYDLLFSQQSKMKLLEVPYGPHPLTKKLHELHLERVNYASVIFMRIREIDKVNYVITRKLVQLVDPLISSHLAYLRQNNETVIAQLIISFFKHLEMYPEIRQALHTLGFKNYLDDLEKANTLHKKFYMKRLEQIARRPKVDVAGIQHETYYILRTLFDQINYYQMLYKETDYSQLINELNLILTEYSGKINRRVTCNKTRKHKAAKVNESEGKVVSQEPKSSIDDINQTKSTEIKKKEVEDKPSSAEKKNYKEDITSQNKLKISKPPKDGNS